MIPGCTNLFKMFKVGLQIIHQSSFDWRFFLLLASLSMLHWTKGSGVQGAYFRRINCMKSSSLHSSITFSKTSSNVLNCAMHCNKESSVFFLFHKTDKRCACTDYIEHLPRQSPDICLESTADMSVYVKNDDYDITNCYDKLPLGSKNERIRILTDGSFVKCDPMTNGAGWIVVQNRESPEERFDRGWDDYVHGFGSLSGNFWFGLNRIHRLCSRKCQMRFTFKYQGSYWAEYNVTIDGPLDNYKLHIRDGFDGTAGDSLRAAKPILSADGMMFSTKDNANDEWSGGNCAELYSAWWSNNCQAVSPNGIWGSSEKGKGILWASKTGNSASVKKIKIRVRPLV